MKLKWIFLSLVIVSLVGCFGDNSKSRSSTRKTEPEKKATADLKKAALLNVEMGEKYLAQGQVSRAKQKFIHALELKPKLPEAHSSIGYFFESVGDLSEAENHYRLAIDYAEGSKGRYYNNYGTFLCRQQRYKEADDAFNKAIKDKQYIKTAEAYENAGMCALQQPDLDKAYTYLQTAMKRDPNRMLANLELASIELKRNNFQAAKHYLDNFKARGNIIARSLWLEIQVAAKLGDHNTVANNGVKLKRMFPKSAEYKLYVESMQNG